MKQLFIMAIAIATLTTTAYANNNEGKYKAPANIVKQDNSYRFADDNKENVTWKTTENFIKATVTKGTETKEIFYTTDGDLLGSSVKMAYDKLPANAITTISKKYQVPYFNLKDCIAYTDAKDKTTYYISFDTPKENVVIEITETGLVNEFSRTYK